MAGLTALITAGALATSAGAALVQHNVQKRAEREAGRRYQQQQIEAEEAAKLKGTAQKDVRVKIGASANDTSSTKSTSKKGTATRTSTSATGGFGVSASAIGGL